MSVAGFRFTVVPHTHWDREWYLPLEHFRLELADRVDRLLDVLERDRRFRVFTLDGQAVLLEDYVELRPEREERLCALLRAGRLSVGPSYVLPDELLVGGESLVRNLLLGRAVCERFGARPSGVGYLPDSFGHPEQLPQILRGFGIGSFLFSRGMGDELDTVGRVFRWVAPDGSAVTALNLPGHYDSAAHLQSGEDLAWRAGRIVELWGDDLRRAGVRDVVMCNGSDHVPVQPDVPSWVRRASRLTGAPFRLASFDEYVATAFPRRLPELRGELLGSREQNVLRGVNSARMYLKQANERAERRLLAAETAATLAALAGLAAFPTADFRFAWRELLRNHPHDSICGCSVDEVHDDMLERYARLERTVTVLERRALAALAGASLGESAGELYRPAPRAAATVLNTLPWARGRLLRVELPAELRRAETLAAELDGTAVPVERDGGAALVAVEVEGFAAAQLALRQGDAHTPSNTVLLAGGDAGAAGSAGAISRRAGPSPSNTVLRGRSRRPWIASDRHLAEAAPDGTLRVVDLATGREASGLLRFEDEPDLGDLYNFCPDPDAAVWRSDARSVERSARVLRATPLVSELELVTRGRLPLRTVVRVVHGGDRVEVETEVDNRTRDHRLRVILPAPRAGATVRAEGQFAVVRRPRRPRRPRTRWVEPPDATQHTLGAVALGDLALLTKGLPEYEARGAELALTLLRCVGLISRPDGLATRPYTAGPGTPTPGGQCPGRHRFEFAFRLDARALSDVELLRASQDYRFELLTGPPGDTPPAPLQLDGEPVAFSCLKPAEDGEAAILRVHAAERARIRIRTEASVSRTRLDETGDRPLPRRAATLQPGEIASFRVQRAV